MKKTALGLILLAALLYSVDLFYYKHKSGFSHTNIRRTNDSVWQDDICTDEILSQLNQEFFFFGKGSQAYVFVSKDGQYILKFLKQHKFRPTSWLAHLPLKTHCREEHLKRQHKRQRAYESIQTAFTQLKKETGLLYAHLNPTQALNTKITVYDKRGNAFVIDLDKEVYFLQKRATLVYPSITHALEKGSVEEAQHLITNLFAFLDHLAQSGVTDHDPIIRRNFGFIDGQAVQIDIGQLKISSVNPSYKKRILSVTKPFKAWLELKHPELIPFFTQQQKVFEEEALSIL